MRILIGTALSLALVVSVWRPALAQQPGADATQRIVTAAQALVETLDDPARAQLQFPFSDPQKTRWSNFPTGIFERRGVRLGDLSAAQRTAVMSLLRTALSSGGYQKVTDVMRADEVLKQQGNSGPARRGGQPNRGGGPPPGARPGGGGGRGLTFGQDEYFLAFVGTPSTVTPWMLQFGGHHLAINMTIAGAQAVMVPSLPGAQPATFTWEGRTVRPLGRENDMAFSLVNALREDQRRQAIIGTEGSDLLLGPGADGKTIPTQGLRGSAMTAQQQAMMLDIAREWVGIMNDAHAAARIAEIRATIADTYFVWNGPTTPGSAAYFRIQGPAIVMEYSPQQGDADHIHGIYRDPANDYGEKMVRVVPAWMFGGAGGVLTLLWGWTRRPSNPSPPVAHDRLNGV